MKIWPFIKAAPEPAPPRRRVSTKLSPAYQTRRVREIQNAIADFRSGKAGVAK